ncbi:hypothetical protein C8R47DRAFT_1222812 [Mycena vitilis]|nr:hypothetical protein C8R47DRAFT_1222812 [Mycena vitilis]
MQLLTRQESRSSSILSWWSDSNPGLRGATINLHAATKPLMKFMYHLQVSELIKQTGDRPLTTELLDIYSSYLPRDYVWSGTKAKILTELGGRAASSTYNARMIVGLARSHSYTAHQNAGFTGS